MRFASSLFLVVLFFRQLIKRVLPVVVVAFISMDVTPSFAQGGEQFPVLAWTKVCPETKEQKGMCMLVQDVRDSKNGGLIASISLRLPKDETPFLLATVPTRVLLQPGMRLQVDEEKQIEGKFLICDSVACLARFPADDGLISTFKKGKALSLIVIMGGSKQATAFSMPLKGFTKSFKGSSIKLLDYNKMREKFAEKIRKTAAAAAAQKDK